MSDDPPSSLQTGKKWAGYTTPLTTGSRAEKATEKPANQAEEEAYAKMVMKSQNVARQRQKQHFQTSLQQKHHLAERSEGAYEILTRRYEALEPGTNFLVSMCSTRKLWKTGLEGGSLDPFDIYPRKNLTMRHHIVRCRWKNEGTFLTKNETEPHINMFPTAKDFPLEDSQEAWIQWVNDAFPDLHGTNFWLPVCAVDFASLYCTKKQSTLDTSQQHCPWYNSVKNDSALQRVLLCLKERSERMFVLSQLYFGQNSGEPCYSAAADYLPPPDSVPPAPLRNWEEGDFDLLIIHRLYGLVVCEVKAFGDNSSKSGMSQQDVDSKIRSKLKEAILQVDRAEAVLSHLVSDIVPGLRITKTIAFPNLTGHQVQQALAEDPTLTEDLCRCLEAADLVSAVGLCLCSEQLYLYGALKYVSPKLWQWWLRCVVRSGAETKMTVEVYKKLVARFCGPAVTVTIPCISPPRLCLKILNQPSPSTTQCSYAVITLFPGQVHLLTMASPRIMLTGLPGTGKTVVLQLKATEWLRCGSDVFLVCTSDSYAACYRMYYLLQQTIETQLAPSGTSGQLHLLEYRFRTESDVENAVDDLSQAATGGVLHVIADEMDSSVSRYLPVFHEKLLTRVPHLHFWAASYNSESLPSTWPVQNLTKPIRFPKMKLLHTWNAARHDSRIYSLRGQYESPRAPPVQRFLLPRHKGSHRSTRRINRCVTCGDHVAKILMDVLAGVPGQGNITTSTAIAPTTSDTTSVRLQYRDVLVLPSIHVSYFMDLETGLRKAGIPVCYMSRDNLEDIVTAREDEVVVADEEDARGLERKVVVVIIDELEDAGRLAISRCTSQLVYITFRGSSDLREYYGDCDKASDDESQRDQNEEKVTDETVAKSHITESEDIEILTSSTLGTDPLYSSVLHPTIPDLSEASLPPTAKPDRSPDECRAGEATENSDDITPSPDTIVESTSTAGSFLQRIRNWFYYVGDTFKWAFGVKSDENSEDDNDVDEKKATEENQKGERKKLETCSKKGATNMEIQSITPFSAHSECCSTQYKITVDLRKTISLKTPQHVRMPNRLHDECDQGKATEKSKDTTSSPIFSYRWQNILGFSTEGGRLRGEGSDVVLTVPSGAVEVNTKVTVHTSVCVNDVYIKHKLKLAATETIVSPLAEFWAGPDFHFKKHVEITLPTCLPSDYDVDLLHVYCITRGGQEEEITVNKIQRLEDMTQTPDKEALEVYFYIKGERQVEVMTSHFSGYVCTYCGLCLNIGLEVYASHRFDNESVQVSVIAQFWDKLHISDFRQWKPEHNSFTVVLSTTFQLKKVLKPAELQVDLIIDDEQKTMWEFKTRPAPGNTFCLNWGEIACVNSTNHPAVKYTDLGPFSPWWKLKSKTSENGVMPSTLEAFLLVSHKTQETVEPLWSSAPCQLDVQPLNGKEKCVSNGTSGNCPVINIENVHGDVTFAQEVHTQKTENVLYIMDNNQSTSKTMLGLEQPVNDSQLNNSKLQMRKPLDVQ